MTPTQLDRLRNIERADVYKNGRLAGSLRRSADETTFDYRGDYLSDPMSEPLAVTLPLVADPTHATGGSVPPFFAGLLPEGVRLSAVIRATKTSEDDQLTVLLAVGPDAIGDVQVVAAGEPLTEPTAALPDLRNIASFTEVFARATSSDPTALERVALPGVQAKVSTGLSSTPLSTRRGPAILKLGAAQYPRIVQNEDFFLRMARACGIETPDHEILHDDRGESALLVTRFDRSLIDRALVRFPQEDACQVLGRYPAAKYRIPLEESIRGLADAVHHRGGSRSVTIRNALEIAAFSYLIGNGDLHAKNLSIYRGPPGVWTLTPAYDLLTTQPYLKWRDPMAVPLFGRANRLKRRWWLEAATLLGITEKAMATRLDAIVASAAPWLERLGEIGFDSTMTDRLRGLIAARLIELR